MSEEYWRIWYDEVCSAYKRLCEKTPKFIHCNDTDKVLHDMDKPVNERKYY
jgi:hypothetical protein